jgi:hypothetical protein
LHIAGRFAPPSFDCAIGRLEHRSVTVKNYVLDTNVLLHDARAMFAFADNNVVIPIFVLEEIDTFKKDQTELGRNARQVARLLDEHRVDGGLSKPQKLDNGGTVRVALAKSPPKNPSYDSRSMDQRILEIAAEVRDGEPAVPCILVTKDVNMRIRGDALGLQTVDYDTEQISIDELYPGHREVTTPAGTVDALYADGGATIAVEGGLYPNEFVLLKDDTTGKSALTRHDKASGKVVPVKKLRDGVWGIRPRNKEQHYALDLLLNDDIKLVTLVGKAGTGKTLLAIAAGLQKVTEEDVYQKLLVSRPSLPARPRHRLPARRHRGEAQPVDAAHLRQPRAAAGPQPLRQEGGAQLRRAGRSGLRPGRAADLHPRPVAAQRLHDRRRGPEPDAARGQDDHHPRRRGHQDHPDRRPVPDRSPVPRLVEQRPDDGGRAVQARGDRRPHHAGQGRAQPARRAGDAGAVKAAAAAALALLAACRAARADDPGFELRIVVPSEVAPGEAAAVSVTLAPAAGRTIAAEGPLRLALDADDALALPRRRYLRKDAADPAADAPRFDVKLRPKAAGDHRLTIDARFWLCAAKTCRR